MHRFALWGSVVLTASLLAGSLPAAEDIERLPVTVTFIVSGGLWEEPGDIGDGNAQASGSTQGQAAAARRGYYKLVSVRQPDRTAKVYLQQIAATDAGPELVNSVELEEFTELKPYVTDIRPEDSTGITRQPGMFATVYLKTVPTAVQPEAWTVLIDELGDIRVERETN
ncbi:hypothetical protein [Rhizobium sp. RU36D]|uniref:hypothetical protein n=1 Tax=Rhizobium sp. RU36D TaxID=1907415 RepID=UPI0009D87872|nr:hypothetical protein [Rhizobium sp. RU36D]SMD05559.1 hypothetical protein SAMN05880593_11850 [Rhizobium sp. RU36D]